MRAPVTDGPAGQIIASGYLPKNGVGPNGGWVKVEATFTATGGEKYLTLGHWGNASADPIPIAADCIPFYHHEPKTPQRAYVYVDDVRLRTATSVACGCLAIIYFEPIIPSPVEGKCCYNVLYFPDSPGITSCIKSCTIEKVVVYEQGNVVPIIDWSASTTTGPIIADGQTRNLGTFCMNGFPGTVKKTFSYQMFGSENQEICNGETRVEGCLDPCNCFDFIESISISSINSGNNPCCYKVALDATILSGCAQIASIKLFKQNTTNEALTEITSAAYNTLVPQSHNGYLYTFCPPQPIAFNVNEALYIEIRDANGELICAKRLPKLMCECDCSSSKAEVIYRSVAGLNNTCCYDVVVRNTSDCKISVNEVVITGSDMELLNVTGSNGWAASYNTAA